MTTIPCPQCVNPAACRERASCIQQENEGLPSAPSASPVATLCTREQMINKAHSWAWVHHKNEGTSKDHYHTQLGLLVDFITHHFPE